MKKPIKIKSATRTQKKVRGDTIVEVLIAIVVVSFVLSQAYNTANRSLRSSQGNQERSESLKFAEQQTEKLRGLASSNPSEVFNPSRPNIFCVDNSSNTRVDFSPNFPITADDVLELYPTECSNIGGRYFVSIERQSGGLFNIRSRWEGFGGISNEVRIAYKIHPGSNAFGPAYIPPEVPCTSTESITLPEESRPLLASQTNGSLTATSRAITLSEPIPACAYDVELIATEIEHASGPLRLDQIHERIFAEAYDSDGGLVFRMGPTDDIPECTNASTFPIFALDPEYYRCTISPPVEVRLAINSPIVRVVFKHIVIWESSYGCPGTVCQDAIEALNSINSVHGSTLKFTPVR